MSDFDLEFFQDQQVQSGLRMDAHLVNTMKQLSKVFDCTIGELIQYILEKALDGELPFSSDELELARNAYKKNIPSQNFDTIVVTAHAQNFQTMFLNNKIWDRVRIAQFRLSNLKYLAVYNVSPSSSIRWYDEIDQSNPFTLHHGKYIINLKGSPKQLPHPVPMATSPLRNIKYTTLAQLSRAQNINQI